MFINTHTEIGDLPKIYPVFTFKIETIFFIGGTKKCPHYDSYYMLILCGDWNHSLFYKQRIWKLSRKIIIE